MDGGPNFDLFTDEGEAEVGPPSAEVGPPSAEVGPPSDDTPEVWSVSQVNEAVRALLEKALPPLWVSGEVANWTAARSGHRYFTLKDEHAQLRCVMWRNDAARLPTDPDEGMTVRAFGSLTLYEARGEFQLVVRRLEGEGAEGLWRLAFEKLRKKLDGEGLLAPERKRPLPTFPERIGIVTSTTGAALHDMVTVLRRRAPWVHVIVRGTRVQGEGAAEEIAHAVRALAASGRVEMLIVGRGGGSIEDLWAFNEEPVARAIAECSIPVISAVGHEVDVTISDLVADLRAPTPSAAAEAAAPDRAALLESLTRAPKRLARGLTRTVEHRRSVVERWRERLLHATLQTIEPRRRWIGDIESRMIRGITRAIELRRHRLGHAVGKIDALSPLSTLRRGYAVPLGEGGRVLRGVEDFPLGGEFTLRVVDGRIICEIRESSSEEAFGE
jgi:exodeoxyribonuclease VII large subunit